MALLVGTNDGLFRVDALPFRPADLERVASCGSVQRIGAFDHVDGVFAATEAGLLRSTDRGDSWEDLGLPAPDSVVWSVLSTRPDRLYAGTNDPYLFTSTDDGETWDELEGFRDLPSRDAWQSPIDDEKARLRVLESPPDEPDRIVAGIESGGFHVSDDGGESWIDRRANGPDDVHQVLALSRDIYVATTGYLDVDLEALGIGHAMGLGGLHRTLDAGRSWTRLDTGNRFGYTRCLHLHDGVLYFSGATDPPPDWMRDGAQAALFESTGLGRRIERVSYPGEPHEVVEAMARLEGETVCGTAAYPPPGAGDGNGGHILRRETDGTYVTAGKTPGGVRSLLAV